MAHAPEVHSAEEGRRRVLKVAAALMTSGSAKEKGDMGERLAKDWFARHDFDFHHWPQRIDNKPRSLTLRGGKRPDFSVDLDDELVHFDAKYHSTAGVTTWEVKESELNEFLAFRDWFKDEYGDHGPRDVFFMLYPLELNGSKFLLVHLDEMLQGEPATVDGEAGRTVSLLDRTLFEQWE